MSTVARTVQPSGPRLGPDMRGNHGLLAPAGSAGRAQLDLSVTDVATILVTAGTPARHLSWSYPASGPRVGCARSRHGRDRRTGRGDPARRQPLRRARSTLSLPCGIDDIDEIRGALRGRQESRLVTSPTASPSRTRPPSAHGGVVDRSRSWRRRVPQVHVDTSTYATTHVATDLLAASAPSSRAAAWTRTCSATSGPPSNARHRHLASPAPGGSHPGDL